MTCSRTRCDRTKKAAHECRHWHETSGRRFRHASDLGQHGRGTSRQIVVEGQEAKTHVCKNVDSPMRAAQTNRWTWAMTGDTNNPQQQKVRVAHGSWRTENKRQKQLGQQRSGRHYIANALTIVRSRPPGRFRIEPSSGEARPGVADDQPRKAPTKFAGSYICCHTDLLHQQAVRR